MGKLKVLVVVDMQNDFINGSLGTKEAEAIVPKAVEKIKDWDGIIFTTQDTHKEDYMETREGKYLPVPHCILATDGWMINPEVNKALGEKPLVTNVTKETFGSWKLADTIRSLTYPLGIKDNDIDITLIGLCTDICVVSNALYLHQCFTEANISVDAECCAGVTPETHLAALRTMKKCQINILNAPKEL